MKCSVKFKLHQISCPGTLHLSDRNPVYMVICLFGRFQKTQQVYPSFPMVFNTKLKFQRIFTNAKTPDHVLEILEDETILIELRQKTKSSKGGHVLASYEECARTFLYPAQSYVPKENHLIRDVLLTKNEIFGKGLSPQLAFSTKTYIEEAPVTYPAESRKNASINQKFPASSRSPNLHSKSVYYPVTSTAKKHIKTRKILSQSMPIKEMNTSSGSDDEKFANVDDYRMKSKFSSSSVSNVKLSGKKHCICECQVLSDGQFDFDSWLETLCCKVDNNQQKTKPFRTGKDPQDLISKRNFSSNLPSRFDRKNMNNALCKNCVVPLKTCVLCNAYKTVYGSETYLEQRFERFRKDSLYLDKQVHYKSNFNSSIPTGRSEAFDYSNQDVKKSPEETFDHNIANFGNRNRNEIFTLKTAVDSSTINGIDSDESDISYIPTYASPITTRLYAKPKVVSLTNRDIFNRSPPTSTVEPAHFHGKYSIVKTNDQSFHDESERIHQRIKELMKKNNSVLQKELSSSSSSDNTDVDQSDSQSFSPYDVSTRFDNSFDKHSTRRRKRAPTSSVVVPLGGGNFWSSRQNNEIQSPRDIFDSRLKHLYEDLYEKTLQQK